MNRHIWKMTINGKTGVSEILTGPTMQPIAPEEALRVALSMLSLAGRVGYALELDLRISKGDK